MDREEWEAEQYSETINRDGDDEQEPPEEDDRSGWEGYDNGYWLEDQREEYEPSIYDGTYSED